MHYTQWYTTNKIIWMMTTTRHQQLWLMYSVPWNVTITRHLLQNSIANFTEYSIRAVLQCHKIAWQRIEETTRTHRGWQNKKDGECMCAVWVWRWDRRSRMKCCMCRLLVSGYFVACCFIRIVHLGTDFFFRLQMYR